MFPFEKKKDWYDEAPTGARILMFIGALAIICGIFGLAGYLNGPYVDTLWGF